MSPRDYRRNRTAADVARAIGATYSLPPTDDRRLQQLVEHHLGDQQPGAPAARVRADNPGHSPGFRQSRVIADLRREVEQLAAEDRADGARAAQRKRLDTPTTNAELAWRSRLAASTDIKNRIGWLVVAEAFEQSRSRAGAANRLLGFAIKGDVRDRAVACFAALLDDPTT